MPQSFASYTDISVNALKFNPKSQELIEKKQEILRSIAEHYGSAPTSMLFYGFNPLILATTCKQIVVTDITDSTKNYLTSLGIKYVYIEEKELPEYKKQFNWVMAGDEYFTFVDHVFFVCRFECMFLRFGGKKNTWSFVNTGSAFDTGTIHYATCLRHFGIIG